MSKYYKINDSDNEKILRYFNINKSENCYHFHIDKPAGLDFDAEGESAASWDELVLGLRWINMKNKDNLKSSMIQINTSYKDIDVFIRSTYDKKIIEETLMLSFNKIKEKRENLENNIAYLNEIEICYIIDSALKDVLIKNQKDFLDKNLTLTSNKKIKPNKTLKV